ncbi:primosomal replication protein N [Pandoraea nosoerga]|uniref:Replication restart protein PriB n=1 Tax=Pandoraea nosoerga TaxID=2508296 RepID=A0A5E4VEP6_9BURK|nr:MULTISPECIES: primosomal replication protein N [Pandoraea]MBN4665960.1 primosomal replication protein N [Pandoraea nosoerga]MBN4676134.1 primosomal replication protein N [Pandoraea nosoerga]MBN4681268.1 primosomal replication protein N [Pandoraea nosoerga]MBN4745244.1 primosomal replication protein N [Pandoraea nosoerga]VVE10621.1 primosomal replication protein N [Pandoraea nosoerga]
MNRLRLEASIAEIGTLRYTPAGLPVIDVTLTHEGTVEEAGVPRQTEFSIPAVAIGPISAKVTALGLGRPAQWAGFLAKKHRNSRTLVFHITALQEFEKDC